MNIFINKIGILTFHYTNNYGAVLQALALYKIIDEFGYNVEIINYVPKNYNSYSIVEKLGIRKDLFKNNFKDLNIINIIKKIKIINQYSRKITIKFNTYYKEREIKLSPQVDENSIYSILDSYSTIIVGSDQVWNPYQRKNPIYFLNFGDRYKGRKISYAADSTIEDVYDEDLQVLKEALREFQYISVRNKHSFEFVKRVIEREPEIFADPTLLFDFYEFEKKINNTEDYILTYILGKEIRGTYKKVIQKIKNKYGNIPVYSIKIPTMNFELSTFADKVFYDLSPGEWISMIKNAKFVYTDSFHGVLFALKYHKPFLAYYVEKLRANRFIDICKRYGINKYIIQDVREIDIKKPLDVFPDFDSIDRIISLEKEKSIFFLKKCFIINK